MSDAVAVSVALPDAVKGPRAEEARETVGGVVSGGVLTVSTKLVVRVSPPPVAETVMVELPVGVVESVETVMMEVQVGEQEVGENDAVAPAGRPEAEKLTDWVEPERREDETELVTELPCATDFAPPFEREKSNEDVVVNVASGDVARFPAKSRERTR